MSGNVSGSMRSAQDKSAGQSYDISQTVILLRRIPDSERTFSISAVEAFAKYKMDVGFMEDLRSVGLPYECHDGEDFFDASDLLNIALRIDYGSTQRKHLAWWIRELDWQSHDSAVSYTMDYVATCPDPSHDAFCRYAVLGLGERRNVYVMPSLKPQVVSREKVTLSRSWPEFPEVLKRLIDDVADIEFLELPERLRWDAEFMSETRVGDCTGMAMLLSRMGGECGLEARFSYGRALTPPLSSPHYWAEFRIDGIWTAVDPLMVSALHRVGLPRERWTLYSSLGCILVRLTDRWEPIALHNEKPTPVRITARREDYQSRADLKHPSHRGSHAP